MTTPEELLDLCDELARDLREAARRTAAPRAYYAAFWHLRAVAEARLGSFDSTGPEIHQEVYRATRIWDEGTAGSLAFLRSLRNTADYDPERGFSVALTDRCVRLAREILKTK